MLLVKLQALGRFSRFLIVKMVADCTKHHICLKNLLQRQLTLAIFCTTLAFFCSISTYRISSNKCPRPLLNFETVRCGAY